MPMNVRESLKYEEDYYPICREERNIAAILYHALLLPGNLTKFLGLIGSEHSDNCEEASIYFEYAYLRDLWKETFPTKGVNQQDLKGNNEKARKLILNALNLSEKRPDLLEMEVCKFNRYFGAAPRPSRNYIQMPATWSIKRMDEGIVGCSFLDICKFKWAFNIKPDVVIHTSKVEAVCVETKVESRESSYPSNSDKKIFLERLERGGMKPVKEYKQTDIQKHLFEELLGMKAQIVLLQKSSPTDPPETSIPLTWDKVFGEMDMDSAPKFIKCWVECIRNRR